MSRTSPRALLVAVLATAVVAGTAGWGLHAFSEGATEDPAPSAVDIGFSQDMSVHHEQGVLMASIAARRGTGVVRTIATSIVESQSQETGTMRGWLALWDAPQLVDGPPMTWMAERHGHGAADDEDEDGEAMPGLATTGDLQQLEAASGARCDRIFLRLMVAHHRGAIVMAGDAARRASLPTVRQLAGRIAREQAQEVVQLETLRRGAASRS